MGFANESLGGSFVCEPGIAVARRHPKEKIIFFRSGPEGTSFNTPEDEYWLIQKELLCPDLNQPSCPAEERSQIVKELIYESENHIHIGPKAAIHLPDRSDIAISLHRGPYGRSKPTSLCSPLLNGPASLGLRAFFDKQEERLKQERALFPDHCVERAANYILQNRSVPMETFLSGMGEIRMTSGLHRFNEGVAKIKKFKSKKRKESRNVRKV